MADFQNPRALERLAVRVSLIADSQITPAPAWLGKGTAAVEGTRMIVVFGHTNAGVRTAPIPPVKEGTSLVGGLADTSGPGISRIIGGQ
jgi:hypothetical protein